MPWKCDKINSDLDLLTFQNIFLGEDIRRQLPGESSDFDNININWKQITTRLNDTRNALRGTTEKGGRSCFPFFCKYFFSFLMIVNW